MGAQKGMIFSTVRYQQGSLEYAKKHGIALALVVDGSVLYEVKSFGSRRGERPHWMPPYAAYIVSLGEDAQESHSLMREEILSAFLDQLKTEEDRS